MSNRQLCIESNNEFVKIKLLIVITLCYEPITIKITFLLSSINKTLLNILFSFLKLYKKDKTRR